MKLNPEIDGRWLLLGAELTLFLVLVCLNRSIAGDAAGSGEGHTPPVPRTLVMKAELPIRSPRSFFFANEISITPCWQGRRGTRIGVTDLSRPHEEILRFPGASVRVTVEPAPTTWGGVTISAAIEFDQVDDTLWPQALSLIIELEPRDLPAGVVRWWKAYSERYRREPTTMAGFETAAEDRPRSRVSLQTILHPEFAEDRAALPSILLFGNHDVGIIQTKPARPEQIPAFEASRHEFEGLAAGQHPKPNIISGTSGQEFYVAAAFIETPLETMPAIKLELIGEVALDEGAELPCLSVKSRLNFLP